MELAACAGGPCGSQCLAKHGPVVRPPKGHVGQWCEGEGRPGSAGRRGVLSGVRAAVEGRRCCSVPERVSIQCLMDSSLKRQCRPSLMPGISPHSAQRHTVRGAMFSMSATCVVVRNCVQRLLRNPIGIASPKLPFAAPMAAGYQSDCGLDSMHLSMVIAANRAFHAGERSCKWGEGVRVSTC